MLPCHTTPQWLILSTENWPLAFDTLVSLAVFSHAQLAIQLSTSSKCYQFHGDTRIFSFLQEVLVLTNISSLAYGMRHQLHLSQHAVSRCPFSLLLIPSKRMARRQFSWSVQYLDRNGSLTPFNCSLVYIWMDRNGTLIILHTFCQYAVTLHLVQLWHRIRESIHNNYFNIPNMYTL